MTTTSTALQLAPEAPFTEWLALMLFVDIVGDHGTRRRVGWSQLRPRLEQYEDLGDAGTWDALRRLVAKGRDLPGVDADAAASMDAGRFARRVLAELPPYEVLLERARRSATPEAFTQVRRLLRKWGLRSRVRRAA
ncbi:MAG: hypothetical protein JWP02_1393 [Acidimicrobiales bacterium]|nr:hypothetical protein [Acidimicrobiales bacterium]